MGIVAYCPNQHRVKVKEDLAGKKGVCPTCGVKFRIPYVSQAEPAPLLVLPAAAVATTATPPVAAAPAAATFPSRVEPPPIPTAQAPVVKPLPMAEIVSMDATLAATLPRAVPLTAG